MIYSRLVRYTLCILRETDSQVDSSLLRWSHCMSRKIDSEVGPELVSKKNYNSPSYRILLHIHIALSIDKKTNYTVYL